MTADTLTITGPDTITHGVPVAITGTLLDTVSCCCLSAYGGFSLTQQFSLDVDELQFTPNTGHPAVAGVPRASLPFHPNSASVGTTPCLVTLGVFRV
jgi:hypothetical protein